MTTRTKLALCAGLLAVAVGVAVLRRPAVEVSFARYAGEMSVVLNVTSRMRSQLSCYGGEDLLILEPQSSGQLKAYAPPPETTISVECTPQRSIRSLLRKAGIDLRPGFDVTVTLPPRETNAPAQPVPP